MALRVKLSLEFLVFASIALNHLQACVGSFVVVVCFLLLFWTITGVWSLDAALDYHWGLES